MGRRPVPSAVASKGRTTTSGANAVVAATSRPSPCLARLVPRTPPVVPPSACHAAEGPTTAIRDLAIARPTGIPGIGVAEPATRTKAAASHAANHDLAELCTQFGGKWSASALEEADAGRGVGLPVSRAAPCTFTIGAGPAGSGHRQAT